MDSRSARIADYVPWIATYVERLESLVGLRELYSALSVDIGCLGGAADF